VWLLCFRMILYKKRSVCRGKHNVSIHDTRSKKSSYDPRSSIIFLSNNVPLRCLPSFPSWSMFNSWSTSHCCCHFIAYLFLLQFEYISRALVFISIWIFKNKFTYFYIARIMIQICRFFLSSILYIITLHYIYIVLYCIVLYLYYIITVLCRDLYSL